MTTDKPKVTAKRRPSIGVILSAHARSLGIISDQMYMTTFRSTTGGQSFTRIRFYDLFTEKSNLDKVEELMQCLHGAPGFISAEILLVADGHASGKSKHNLLIKFEPSTTGDALKMFLDEAKLAKVRVHPNKGPKVCPYCGR